MDLKFWTPFEQNRQVLNHIHRTAFMLNIEPLNDFPGTYDIDIYKESIYNILKNILPIFLKFFKIFWVRRDSAKSFLSSWAATLLARLSTPGKLLLEVFITGCPASDYAVETHYRYLCNKGRVNEYILISYLPMV